MQESMTGAWRNQNPTKPKGRCRVKTTETERTERIVLQPFNIERVKVRLVGTAPLMVQAFGKKAIQEMLDKQTSKEPKARKKPPRDIEAEIKAARILNEKGKPCIPAVWIKNAMLNAGMRYYDLESTRLRGLIWVLGDLLPFEFRKEDVDRRIVRLKDMARTAMARFRPIYHDWSVEAEIEYDASQISVESVLTLLRRAGLSISLGEYRVERKGNLGTFGIETAQAGANGTNRIAKRVRS